MNVLALDLGMKTGWAYHVVRLGGGRGVVESGVQTFALARGESPGMRYHRFNRWLDEFMLALDVVVYEQNFRRGGAATEVANGMATRVQEYCAIRGIDHTAVNAATLKKWTTGAGNADKDTMHAAAVRRGWISRVETVTDDEVDAVCLLRYALATIAPAREKDMKG